jgi:hypothetical protein
MIGTVDFWELPSGVRASFSFLCSYWPVPILACASGGGSDATWHMAPYHEHGGLLIEYILVIVTLLLSAYESGTLLSEGK